MTQEQTIESFLDVISDYRKADGIPVRSSGIVNRWLAQFPSEIQDCLLGALLAVLRKSYISERRFREYFRVLLATKRGLEYTRPPEYWRRVNLLNIQRKGRSQRELLALFDDVLKEIHGFGIAATGSNDGDYIYLDDCIATGTTLRQDLCAWLETNAPQRSRVLIVAGALYQGWWHARDAVSDFAKKVDKEITIDVSDPLIGRLENRKSYRTVSDVLWPCTEPKDFSVSAYVRSVGDAFRKFEFRSASSMNSSHFFSDEMERTLLEKEFLIRGCRIWHGNDKIPKYVRPLGFQALVGFGFGSMVVTYRNCPNNCPLVLWKGDRTHPALFPRRTDRVDLMENSWEEL